VGLALVPADPVLLNNRSAALLQAPPHATSACCETDNPEAAPLLGSQSCRPSSPQAGDARRALLDAESCIAELPEWHKGWLRAGLARKRMGDMLGAYGMFLAAAQALPHSTPSTPVPVPSEPSL